MFTYVRRDFIDGENMYDAGILYKRFRQRQQVWRFGLDPDDVSAFVAEYGWRLVEQAGPDYFLRQLHSADRPQSRSIAARVVGVRAQDLAQTPPISYRGRPQGTP